jgi:hypothetical protein
MGVKLGLRLKMTENMVLRRIFGSKKLQEQEKMA